MSDSIWLADPAPPRPPLKGRLETRVAIIGGGATGVLLARFLTEAKVPCLILERDSIGSGATGGEPGVAVSDLPVPYSVARHHLGTERARALVSLLARNREALSRSAPGFMRTGVVRAASTESEAKLLRRSFSELRDEGIQVEPFDLEGFHAAMRLPEDGIFDPIRHLRTAASGLEIFEGSEVTSLSTEGADAVARTRDGEVRASVAVVAAGGWTGRLVRALEGAVIPTRSQACSTEPDSKRLPAPVLFDFGTQLALQRPDGRVIVSGGRRLEGRFHTTTEATPTTTVQTFLSDSIRDRFRIAARPERRWAWIAGRSCDDLPNVGFIPGTVNLFAATGCGLELSAVLARMAADLIVTGTSDLPFRLFDPRRHQ